MKSKLKPIILHHQPALSLDSGGVDGAALSLRAPLPSSIDITQLLDAIGLSEEEREFLHARVVGELCGQSLAEALGWTKHQTAAARKRVTRKLRNFAEVHDPAQFTVSGYVPPVMGPEFLEVLAGERRALVRPG